MQNKEALPPYVKFSQRAVEDRSKELTAGKYGWKTVDFVEVTRPGQNDTHEREAQAWLDDLGRRAEAGLVPLQWHEHFLKAYAAWKEGNEIPEGGTPLKAWPLIDPAQVEHLLYLKIRTVEALAGLEDEALRKLGIGALELRRKAQAWVQAADSTGVVAAKLETLQVENAALREQVETMQRQLATLVAREKVAV